MGTTRNAGTIVVGVDGSPMSDAALLWAAAQADRDGAELQIRYLVPMMPAVPAPGVIDFGDPQQLAGHVTEDALSKVHAAHPGLAVTSEARPGRAAPALIEASRRAAMVVLGARGHGRFAGLLLGSVSQQVAMHATCPVVVVRGSGRPDAGPVVVGVDGSTESEQALRFAQRQAQSLGRPVRAVRAEYVEMPPGVPPGSWYGELVEEARTRTEEVRATVDDIADELPDVDVELRVVHYHPVAALVDESTDASLLVVASRGLGGFAGLLLGSVSQGVLSRATVPVAIVPRSDAAPGEAEQGPVAQ
ncbi:universal stress protein [Georgenia sunbinii]|uniref:universal stress protein n=1 Tax=Georgenia sunbinii TaxID=3117728 RepID=UPI002F266C8E